VTVPILTVVTALGEVVGSTGTGRTGSTCGQPRVEHGLTSLGGTWALD
jgi:hypothetical protein